MATQQANSAIGGAAMLALGIIAPVIYGAMGFVFGALGAWIYNLISNWLGGIADSTWNQFLRSFSRREQLVLALPHPERTILPGVKIKSLADRFEPAG